MSVSAFYYPALKQESKSLILSRIYFHILTILKSGRISTITAGLAKVVTFCTLK